MELTLLCNRQHIKLQLLVGLGIKASFMMRYNMSHVTASILNTATIEGMGSIVSLRHKLNLMLIL